MTRPHITWVVLAAALAFGMDVEAQQPSPTTLVARAGWVRLTVLEGRLTAVPLPQHRNRSTTLSDPDTGLSEMLSVSAARGLATLHFQRTDDAQQLTVDFVRGDTVSIHREPRGESPAPALHFTQGEGEVSLTVGDDANRQFATAADLWRLVLFNRQLCQDHLLPLLASLRPDWSLLDTADRAQTAMVRAIEFDLPQRRERCLELVDQLASPNFKHRRAAYSQLEAMGQMALACLGDLDRYELDAEQRHRLRMLSGALSERQGDTPDMIAARLIDDLSVWLLLLESDQPRVRRMALEQVEHISGSKQVFDVDAEAPRRSEQLAQLRQRFGQ